MSQNLETVDQSRARTIEVGISVGNVDPATADTTEVGETGMATQDQKLFEIPIRIETTTGNHEHIRIKRDDLFPGNRAGSLSCASDPFDTPREMHQFR